MTRPFSNRSGQSSARRAPPHLRIPLRSPRHHAGASSPLPPRPQKLFWDLLDPVAAAPYSAHAFQRQQLPEIERRCAQLRVRAVAPVVGKPVEALGYGVERAIGHCTERGFEIQLVRIPRHGLPWGACCTHLAAMEAARELALSRHFAAFLGVERAPGARYDEYRLELFGGPSLAAVVRAHGPLPEASMLFTHWRRELLEARRTRTRTRTPTLALTLALSRTLTLTLTLTLSLILTLTPALTLTLTLAPALAQALLHLSSHCTFLLRRTVALEHVRPVEQGGRGGGRRLGRRGPCRRRRAAPPPTRPAGAARRAAAARRRAHAAAAARPARAARRGAAEPEPAAARHLRRLRLRRHGALAAPDALASVLHAAPGRPTPRRAAGVPALHHAVTCDS